MLKGELAGLRAKGLLHRAATHRDLLTNTFTLVGTTVVTSGLGFVYWWVAARGFSTEAVGLASAAISAMSLLGTLSMLGLGTLLIGELPRQPQKRISFVVTALLASGAVGFALGLLFAAVGGYLSSELKPLFDSWGSSFIFAFGVSLTAITLVLDQALIGMLRGSLQLWRNGLFAVTKLAALGLISLVLAEKLGLAIYTTWLIGNLLSLVILSGLALYKGIRWPQFRPEWGLLRGLGRAAVSHHLLNLALLTPNLLLPMVVTIMLSATTNAHFYVANMVASVVFMGPAALTTVLFAVGASNMALLAGKMRFTLKLAFSIALAANLFLTFAAGPLLSLFGATYAQEASWTLRRLGLGVFPVIIKDHFVALHRIQGRTGQAIGLVVTGTLLELGGAVLGAATNGLVGLSIGFVIGMTIEALFMGPAVYRAVTVTNPVTQELEAFEPEAVLVGEAETSLTLPKN